MSAAPNQQLSERVRVTTVTLSGEERRCTPPNSTPSCGLSLSDADPRYTTACWTGCN